MTCQDLDNRLPAYLEGLLPPEEKGEVEEHMALCPRCRRALADLRKTGEFLRNLDEVEPPPFFAQRIISRVREEAGQPRGIFRRLFYPLHVKIPFQSLAVILVAVLGLYLYDGGVPEIRSPAPPSQSTGKSAKAMERAAAPPAASRIPAVPAAQRAPDAAPAGELRRSAAPAAGDERPDRTAEDVAPLREDRRQDMRSALQAGGAETKDLRPSMPGLSVKSRQESEERKGGGPAETPSPARSDQKTAADRGAAAEADRTARFAPPPPPAPAAAAMDLSIEVVDVSVAFGEIDGLLRRYGARVVERRLRGDRGVLKAEIAARQADALLEGLAGIGRLRGGKRLDAVPDGAATIRIHITGRR